MNKSRFGFISCLVSFVLIFTVFSYISPLQASNESDAFYYYDAAPNTTTTRKASQPTTQKKSQRNINNSTNNDEETYEVYLVKVNKQNKRNIQNKPLTFSQMASAINKKQKMRRISKKSVTQLNTYNRTFF